MDNHITVIHQYPVPIRETFDSKGSFTLSSESFTYALNDCLDLREIISCTDNKIIGDDCQVFEMQYDDISRLFILCRLDSTSDLI